MKSNNSKRKIIKAIKDNKSFIITAHISPEGDAIGSELALASLLRRLKKKVCVVNQDSSKQLNFLTRNGLITNNTAIRDKFDVSIVLDCPLLSRVGKVEGIVNNGKLMINIDHHISNEDFADINWVNPIASCTGEIIYELFEAFNLKLNDREALYIYIAILTDTGSFRYSNTSSRTHEIVSKLLNYKIKPHLIYDKIYGNIDISYIKFLCDILSTLKREGSIAYITLRQSPEELKSGLNEKLEDFVNYARALKGVKVAMLFRRISKKKIKVSLRSKGDFDVNNLAGKFGGGGHRSASGCVIEGDIEEVKKKVLKVAKVLVNK